MLKRLLINSIGDIWIRNCRKKICRYFNCLYFGNSRIIIVKMKPIVKSLRWHFMFVIDLFKIKWTNWIHDISSRIAGKKYLCVLRIYISEIFLTILHFKHVFVLCIHKHYTGTFTDIHKLYFIRITDHGSAIFFQMQWFQSISSLRCMENWRLQSPREAKY